jgi:hypothetical protein
MKAIEMSLANLPQDILEKIFILLGADLKDICNCSSVCRAFQNAASSASLWRELAYWKFGKDLAKSTSGLYYGNWKQMVLDDNKEGAIPSLQDRAVTPCYWKHNSWNGLYYCCLVTSVRWHRKLKEVRVYIDVRGETDLRHPMGSSMVLSTEDFPTDRIPLHRQYPASIIPLQFVSELDDSTSPNVQNERADVVEEEGVGRRRQFYQRRLLMMPAGNQHYKGYLSFPEFRFQSPGDYHFCYANRQHAYGDYQSVCLFSLPAEGGLEGTFAKRGQYQPDVSPFARETPDMEKERWTKNIPSDVMARSDWYV